MAGDFALDIDCMYGINIEKNHLYSPHLQNITSENFRVKKYLIFHPIPDIL